MSTSMTMKARGTRVSTYLHKRRGGKHSSFLGLQGVISLLHLAAL
jgi:hypothetical protein